MISISAPTYDLSGSIISPAGTAIQQSASRRASRVATLDGGATPVDGGWSDADLTFECRLPDPDGSHHLALTRLMRYHSTAIMSCSRGCYSVLLSNLTYDRGVAVCTAEVLEVA